MGDLSVLGSPLTVRRAMSARAAQPHPYEVQDRELSLCQTATPGLEGGDPILLLAGNTSSLALKGSCLPPRLLGCTYYVRIRTEFQTRHPEQRFTPPIFFLTGVYLPRPARRLSAPRQPTLRGAFCFDNSRTRSGPTRRPGAASDGGRRPYRGTPIKGRRWNPPELARQGDTHTAWVGDAAISLGETPPTPKLGRRAPRLPKRT